MKRHVHILSFILCRLVLYAVNASAGEFFERNGVDIDGYDPVAYFDEQRPVKGVLGYIQ